jgi:enterochelin esterase-like enzyme
MDLSHRSAGVALALAVGLALGACAQSTAPTRTTGAAGSSPTGTAGAGAAGTPGTAGAGTAGSTATGTAGSGAAGTNATGTAGAAAGATGTAGAGPIDAGTAGSGAAGTGTPDAAPGETGATTTHGAQADPGTDGDGTFALAAPYNLPPESLGPINNAPKGVTTGPFLHAQTGTYTGWPTWKFTYYVYVPSQYKPGHAAALMIFNDGYLYAGINALTDVRFNAPQVFDNLIKEGTMPVTIAVFIFPGTNDGHQVGGGDNGRGTQYDTPNDQYGKFLRDEFLPTEILNKYDIVTDPDGWAMAGHSSGGIASIIAGWFHSDRWHKMLTASPSFPNMGGKFPDLFNTAPAKPLRIYHTAGTMDLGGYRAANDKAAMILQALHYHDRYRQTTDVHYPPHAAMADFAEALRWLWRGYTAGL